MLRLWLTLLFIRWNVAFRNVKSDTRRTKREITHLVF
nr:MAG TPA: hypothetical protein [Crassvirales sp.]